MLLQIALFVGIQQPVERQLHERCHLFAVIIPHPVSPHIQSQSTPGLFFLSTQAGCSRVAIIRRARCSRDLMALSVDPVVSAIS